MVYQKKLIFVLQKLVSVNSPAGGNNLSASGSEQTFYPHYLWSYVKRVLGKKGGRTPNVASTITALNTYKPENFGVTIVGVAEERKTRTDRAAVVYAQFKSDGRVFDVCLTLAEIHALQASADPRFFVPSLQKWHLAPKDSPNAVAYQNASSSHA